MTGVTDPARTCPALLRPALKTPPGRRRAASRSRVRGVRGAVTACLASAGLLPLSGPCAAPLTLADYLRLTGPAPQAHIAYGPQPSQFAELFLPAGDGPFAVAVLVHGGCWRLGNGGLAQLHDLAGALRSEGIAVWNVEYRRVDEPGGGYPGMYQDASAALARLAELAPQYQLDTGHLVAIGHSSGGLLVQWLAGRERLPAGSPLREPIALPVRKVVSLGGLADLRHQRDRIQSVRGVSERQLAGPLGKTRTDRFADTSAAELLPNASHTVLINGAVDEISPPQVAADFARRARAKGDRADTLVLPGASHFDEVSSASPAWRQILPVIRGLLAEPGGEPPPPPADTASPVLPGRNHR